MSYLSKANLQTIVGVGVPAFSGLPLKCNVKIAINIQETLLESLFSLHLWQIPRGTYFLRNFERYFFAKLPL